MKNKMQIGTVGLGLMGCSIATCILVAGHPVTSLVKDMVDAKRANERINGFLNDLFEQGLITETPEAVLARHLVTDDIDKLREHEIIIESIFENVEEKRVLFKNLELVLPDNAIIGSNTSAIPISILQEGLIHPERVIGVHWGEPAHITRFMEVICGQQSDVKYAERIIELAVTWGKEPALVKKDIRGFITNRLMYALMREAFSLVENGYANIEDVDRSVRNDLGYWMTFAGPFRFMDLTGIPAYLNVMKDLFPELDNSKEVPDLIKNIVEKGGKGVSNAHGFYSYTKESAEKWEQLFTQFSFKIRELASKYPQNVGDI
ncbi:MAG: 3-hydroxyacyl-CoA dehydrogenase family protein [Bacteroidota bacterium]